MCPRLRHIAGSLPILLPAGIPRKIELLAAYLPLLKVCGIIHQLISIIIFTLYLILKLLFYSMFCFVFG